MRDNGEKGRERKREVNKNRVRGRQGLNILPSNSAGPTPTMMMDMGRHEALKREHTHTQTTLVTYYNIMLMLTERLESIVPCVCWGTAVGACL